MSGSSSVLLPMVRDTTSPSSALNLWCPLGPQAGERGKGGEQPAPLPTATERSGHLPGPYPGPSKGGGGGGTGEHSPHTFPRFKKCFFFFFQFFHFYINIYTYIHIVNFLVSAKDLHYSSCTDTPFCEDICQLVL